MKKLLYVLLAVIALSPINSHAQNIAVVELFTTQGCASCPPADRIFEQYAKNAPSNLIALSCHVTYFDRAAWQDKLSNTFCDNRHQAYFKSLKLRKMFTPQMIINGKFDIVGNKSEAISAGTRMAMSVNTIRPIQAEQRNGYLDITLPKMRLDAPADVWLLGYTKTSNAIISAGQNKGEVINYMNSVSTITKLMSWNGTYVNMAYPTAHINADGFAIIAQSADHTDIIAAGMVE